MKSIRPRIHHWLAAILLLLFVATAAMWIRSFWAADYFSYQRNHMVGRYEKMIGADIWSTRAGLYVIFLKGTGKANSSAEMSLLRHASYHPFPMHWMIEKTFLRRHGFFFYCGPSDNGYVNSVLASWSWGFSFNLPYWLLLFILPIYPAWRIYRGSHRRKPDGKTCHVCGYDLRATPHRCPECGTVPSVSNSN
jgi:hypothetical protein